MVKRPPFLRLAHFGWFLAAFMLSLVDGTDASGHDWLLGEWKGQYRRCTEVGAVTMTFRDEAGNVKWTWAAESREFTTAAEGVVTKADASSLELAGKYTAHQVTVLIGTAMRISLRGSASTLSGTGITERVNRPFGVELTKVK